MPADPQAVPDIERAIEKLRRGFVLLVEDHPSLGRDIGAQVIALMAAVQGWQADDLPPWEVQKAAEALARRVNGE